MRLTAGILVVVGLIACAVGEFCQLDGTISAVECTHTLCGSNQKSACVNNICTCAQTTVPPPTTTAPPPQPTSTGPPPSTVKPALSCDAKSTCTAAMAGTCPTDRIHCFDNKCQCEATSHPSNGCNHAHECYDHTRQHCSHSDTHCWRGRCTCFHIG